MPARNCARIAVTVIGISAISAFGVPGASARPGSCAQSSVGQVCIASFVGGTAPSGVEGYFFNNQGGANTGSMIIFNETTGHAVKTCASSTVAAGDFGPTCTRDTTTGDRFFAEFSAKSGIVYTSPIITGPTS